MISLLIRSEQKNSEKVNNIMQKSTKPGDLNVAGCPRSFSVANSCMLLPNRERSMKCEVDSSLVSEVMPQLIFLCAFQLMSEDSKLDGEEQRRSSTKVYSRSLETKTLRERPDIWVVPKQFPPMQTFPLHILYHLSTIPARRAVPKDTDYSSKAVKRKVAYETEHIRPRTLSNGCL